MLLSPVLFPLTAVMLPVFPGAPPSTQVRFKNRVANGNVSAAVYRITAAEGLRGQTGLVYCRSRARCEVRLVLPCLLTSVRSKYLISFSSPRFACSPVRVQEVCAVLVESGASAGVYHAGLSNAKREEVQRAWMQGEIKVVCATVAFGMGIGPHCLFG